MFLFLAPMYCYPTNFVIIAVLYMYFECFLLFVSIFWARPWSLHTPGPGYMCLPCRRPCVILKSE